MDVPHNPFGDLQVLLLSLPAERLALLRRVQEQGENVSPYSDVFFREPVPGFDHSRSRILVCFIHDLNHQLTHLAIGRKGESGGTGLAQIEFTYVEYLTHPVSLAELLARLEPPFSKLANKAHKANRPLPPSTSHAVLRDLLDQYPAAQHLIDRALPRRKNPLSQLPAEKQFAFQQQKDAVLMSLELAGMNRKLQLRLDCNLDRPPKSFLEGLPESRLRESAMLISDFRRFPGYRAIKDFIQNAIHFSDGHTCLTVMLVHQQPLETLIGADLIYYNETFNSFVMVQYKAMEKEESDHVFRLPNKDLAREISNMQMFLADLKQVPRKSGASPAAFRLSSNPFFLKFCPREVKQPDNIDLVPGMYFPLGYWISLVAGEQLTGPKGGKALRYDNSGRYFNNSEFATFVSKAWIGTRIEQSQILERVIRATLESGRAVTIAQVSQADPESMEPFEP